MKCGFIGFGNLAKAIYQGLKSEKGVSFAYFDKRKKGNNPKFFNSLEKLVQHSDAIFVCVKPQNLSEVLSELAKFDLTKKVIISPVAGKNIAIFKKFLGEKTAILRIMPNLAVAYKKSVIAYCGHEKNNKLVVKALKLLAKLGKMVELTEEQIHLYTPIFGSGPAFLLKVLETFHKKAKEIGLSPRETNGLLVMLLSGTLAYLENNTKKDIAEMIADIASPGGVTEAGLNFFKEKKLDGAFENLLEVAQNKSRELGR